MLDWIAVKENGRIESLGKGWNGKDRKGRRILEPRNVYEISLEPGSVEAIYVSSLYRAFARRISKCLVDDMCLAEFCILVAKEKRAKEVSERFTHYLRKIVI